MNDLLYLFAEVGVGFTGFAALASVLGRGPTAADVRIDRVRLRNLAETGVTVVLASLLPLLLQQVDGGAAWTWRVSAASLTALLLVLMIFQAPRAREIRRLPGYSAGAGIAFWSMGLATLGILVVSQVSSRLVPLEIAHITALFLLTGSLGLYFVRVAASLLTHNVDRADG